MSKTMSTRRRGAMLAVCLTVALGALALGQEGTITLLSGGEKITLLHHSVVPSGSAAGLDALAQHVATLEADHARVLLLYPGGAASGTAPAKVVEALNRAGHVASGLGAYELSQSPAAFARAAAGARFPYVAANLSNLPAELGAAQDGPAVTTVGEVADFGGQLVQGVLFSDPALSTCVFGLVDPAFQGHAALLGEAGAVGDPAEAAEAMVVACEDAGADLIVALIYLTGDTRWDARIKGAVPGVDVFVVGGTGERFDPEQNPAAHLVQTSKGLSLSVQTDLGPMSLGQLDLTVSSKRIFEFGYRQMLLGGGGAPSLVWLVALGLALLAAGWWALGRGM